MTEQAHQRSVEDVFSEVYDRNMWGGMAGEFYSGPGSAEALAEPYCAWLAEFIAKRFQGVATVIDLGCGDFRVGRRLVARAPGIAYIGVDVAPKLIADNVRRYSGPRVSFRRVDIVAEPLPDGDICLIRQVLQHLSNDQVKRILDKVSQYRYVFVTEHYPATVQIPNLDKPPNNYTRRRQASAVYLDEAPFNVSGVELILTVPYHDEETSAAAGEELRTFKIEKSIQ